MDVTIQAGPAYAIAYCSLESGERVRSESGAMVLMSAGVHVSNNPGPGGIAKGLVRRTLGGESFWMPTYTAQAHGAWVAFASKYPGDISVVDLADGPGVVANSGSLLAVTDAVAIDVKFSGLNNMLMHEGATQLRTHGRGKMLLAAYGGLLKHPLGEGESLIVDTGHLVAYSYGMDLKVGPLGGVVTATLSGEGLVARLNGPGNVWVQTRAINDLRGLMAPDPHSKR